MKTKASKYIESLERSVSDAERILFRLKKNKFVWLVLSPKIQDAINEFEKNYSCEYINYKPKEN